MTEPVTIGTSGVRFVKDAVTKMMTLNLPATSGTLSLHDDTGVDYQVPVGKKFIILKIFTGGGFTGNTTIGASGSQFIGKVYTNTITDSITGGILVFQNNGGRVKTTNNNYGNQSSQSSTMNAETYIEVSAGKYIVGSTGESVSINVTGVETDV